ncbi:MAG: polysaccharide deacetylase family protein [Chloroflexi bacterium]|nr:polysaccharide deacetylase family protein [Chloroflexota bacterium]
MSLKYFTHGRRDQMKVALTFDDGPNPPRTDQVIEILNNRGARGTFFVLGKWVDRFPQAFMRIVESQHCIGNHSYLHQTHLGDFDRAEAAIGNLLGRPTEFLRAHYFNFFTCLYSPVALAPGMKIIDADVNPADYAKSDPQAIVEATLGHPNLAGGSIIDLHDGRETDDDALRLASPLPMIEALHDIIDGLRAKGFELVGLDEMEFVDPIEWRPDGRGTFASSAARAAIERLGRQST